MKPLSLGASTPYFLVPSAVFLGSVHGLMPALDRAGVDLFAIFLIGLGGPLALLLVATFVALRREGTPREQWRTRLRLGPMGKGGWPWTTLLGRAPFIPSGPRFFWAVRRRIMNPYGRPGFR